MFYLKLFMMNFDNSKIELNDTFFHFKMSGKVKGFIRFNLLRHPPDK